MIELSVVVPTHDRRSSVLRAIGALAAQHLEPARFEVVVVVDGSTDGTAGALRVVTTPFDLVVVEQPQRGRAAACNAGWSRARGAIVLFLDDDMEPEPACLSVHLERHRAPRRDLVIGAAPVTEDGRSTPASRYVRRRFDRHLANLARPGRLIGARDVYTGHASVPRAELEAVGGFDEGFRGYGNEDVDLVRRLRETGVDVTFSSEAVARQHLDKDAVGLVADARARGRSLVRLADKDAAAGRETKDGATDPLRHRGGTRRRVLRSTLLRLESIRPGTLEVAAAAVDRLLPAWPDAGAKILEPVLDAGLRAGIAAARSSSGGSVRHRPLVAYYTAAEVYGGAEAVLATHLLGLDRSRWRTMLIHHGAPGLAPLLEQAANAGVETTVVPGKARLQAVAAFAALVSALRTERPALVHAHLGWLGVGPLLYAAAAVARCPIVVTVHLDVPTVSRRALLRQRVLGRAVEVWVAVSDSVAEGVARRVPVATARLVVVRNGIDMSPFDGASCDHQTREALGGVEGNPLIVVPAQLRPSKGHVDLLEAVASVPAATFALVGEGPEFDAIAARIVEQGHADRVRLCGFRRDMAAVLACADVVVLPSRQEGLSLALLESMAAGRPIVATAVGGTGQALVDGVTGILAPPREPERLARAINDILSDPRRAADLGTAAAQDAHARFGAERMLGTVERIYVDVLSSRRPGLSGRAAETPRERARAGGSQDIRAIDWRFLLEREAAPDRPLGRRPWRWALGTIGAELVALDAADPGSCDVAVLGGLRPDEISQAAAALGPGGTCIAAVRADQAGRVASRVFAAAGFVPLRSFVRWPSARATRVWLPCDPADAERALAARWLDTGRRSPRVFAARLTWALRRATARIGPIVILAARERGPGALDLVGIPDDAVALVTGGTSDANKVVRLRLKRADPGGSLHVAAMDKVARTPASVDGLRNEALVLDALWSGATPPPRIPRVLAVTESATSVTLAETVVDGSPLGPRVRALGAARTAALMADWLIALAVATQRDSTIDRVRSVVEPILAAFERDYGAVLDDHSWNSTRARIAGLGAVPLVCEHRDFAPWNLLVGPDGLGVVDWESAALGGVPLTDLLYGLAYLAAASARRPWGGRSTFDALRLAWEPETSIGSAARAAIDRYRGVLGLGAQDEQALRLLVWLIHARSEASRLAAHHEGAPPAAALRGATFYRLWRAEIDRTMTSSHSRARPRAPRS